MSGRCRWYDEHTIVTGRDETEAWFKLDLQAPDITAAAEPGQFVMVRVSSGSDPLLRRPFSVHDVDPDRGILSLLIAPVGRGTDMLSQVEISQQVAVSGPFGTGFGAPPAGRQLLLIGGGIGAAPLLFAARRWQQTSVAAVIGARSKQQLPPLADMEALTTLTVATDDGSTGIRGSAVDAAAGVIDGSDWVIWACGPQPMLRAVRDLSLELAADCYVSVETAFACGVGACAGCAVARADGRGYWRACSDGPVFPAGEVLL